MTKLIFTKVEFLSGNQFLGVLLTSSEASVNASIEYDFSNKQKIAYDLKELINKEIIPELESRDFYTSLGLTKILFNQEISGLVKVVYDSAEKNKVKFVGLKDMQLKLILSEEEVRFIFECLESFSVPQL